MNCGSPGTHQEARDVGFWARGNKKSVLRVEDGSVGQLIPADGVEGGRRCLLKRGEKQPAGQVCSPARGFKKFYPQTMSRRQSFFKKCVPLNPTHTHTHFLHSCPVRRSCSMCKQSVGHNVHLFFYFKLNARKPSPHTSLHM